MEVGVIVEHLLPIGGERVEEEGGQSLRMGEARQAGEELEGAVGTQEGRGFQAIQPQDYGVHQGQYHLGQMVSAVASEVGQARGQKMAKLQHLQKFMEEAHTAGVRQTRMITGDSNISSLIWPFQKSSPPV